MELFICSHSRYQFIPNSDGLSILKVEKEASINGVCGLEFHPPSSEICDSVDIFFVLITCSTFSSSRILQMENHARFLKFVCCSRKCYMYDGVKVVTLLAQMYYTYVLEIPLVLASAHNLAKATAKCQGKHSHIICCECK